MIPLRDLLFVMAVSLPSAWLAGLFAGLCIAKYRQRKAGLALYRAGLNGRAMNSARWGVQP